MYTDKDSVTAVNIWLSWKAMRQARANVARAIRLYDCLLQGDVSKFHKLMREYFPGYGMSLGMEVSQAKVAPAPIMMSGSGHKPKVTAKAQIVIDKEAYNDNDDDDGLNWSGLQM